MNYRARFTLPIVLLALLFALAQAQSDKKESTTENHESLSQRIGSIVDDVIHRIEKEFSGRRDGPDLNEQELRRVNSRGAIEDSTTAAAVIDSSITYQGNTVIQRGDTLNSSVIVKAGNLTVYGRINGDVLIVGGDLDAKGGAYISGNVKIINGEVNKDDDAVIVGYIDKTSSTKEKPYRETEKDFRRTSTRLRADWVSETTNMDNFIFRYNRVEGLFLGLGSEKRYYWDGQHSYSGYGSVGYGFRSHNWRANLGISRQFVIDDGRIFEVEVEGHSLTDTKDDWLIGVNENTAAAILIHEDYRDYFRRDGVGASLGYVVQQDYFTSQVKIGYLADQYKSMQKLTEWSVFGGDKMFRANPAIDNGRMKSIVASAGVSTVTTTIYGPEGWSILGTADFADKNFGSDFGFHRYVADVRRYQPLGRLDNLNLRLRVGTSDGTLPLQKTFDIGGLGTMPGFPFKDASGNRMLLMNAEMIVNGDFLDDLSFWPTWLMQHINLLVLTDAGLVRTEAPSALWTAGFSAIRFSDFQHDVGIGIANRSGSFRLAFVWRTDRSEPARVVFRVARPF